MKIQTNFKYDLTNQHVIIVEDMCDSGKTLAALVDHITKLKIASLRIISLIGTKETGFNKVDTLISYIWEKKPNVYYVGYGLDDNEHYRQLTSIYIKK